MESQSHTAAAVADGKTLSDKKDQNDAVDLVKFIASMMIFAMHLKAFDDIAAFGFAFELLMRWCVPFFFITTSYFLFSKSVNGNITADTLKKYLKRISILYLIYFIYNLPSTIYYDIIKTGGPDLYTILMFVKKAFFSAAFFGAWFINSCFFSAVLIYFLSKKFRTKTVVLIAGIIQLISILSSVYSKLLPAEIQPVLGFLCYPLNIFGGVLYFALGKYIYENRDRLLKIHSGIYSAVFIASYILFFAECITAMHFGYYYSSDAGFALIPISVSLVLLLLKCRASIKNHLLLRKLSTIIYFGQGNIILLSGLLMHRFHTSYLVKMLVGFVLMAIFSSLVLLIQKSGKFRWAKYLS